MKNITLITTGQPATTPRLVKEAESLAGLGYSVNVIYSFYESWADAYDKQIIERHPSIYLMCGGHPDREKWLYLKTRLRQKLYGLLFKIFPVRFFAANAIGRTFKESAALAAAQQSDLYIAHNLAALPAAVSAARRCGAKVVYDAEDLNSAQFESNKDDGYRLNKYIEEQYFPFVTYFTAASPLIASNYKKMYEYISPVVVNNVFPRTDRPPMDPPGDAQPLKLFWFSQTIGPDRGLEQAIVAIGISEIDVRFELWGHCTAGYRDMLNATASANGLKPDQLIIHKPVAPDDIFEIASNFDIGLAGETGHSLNREICLTNKIFTYIQCGLAVLASDTAAQSLFLMQYPAAGLLYKKDSANDLADRLKAYDADRAALTETKRYNYTLGQTSLNWETESRSFLQLIETDKD